ncbi:MAG: hypothetical protein JNJ49_14230 [Bdellovibrionaceae bacterium]|nr:hypothetical protein [Pseudobdellovibrionaceae bacterium]
MKKYYWIAAVAAMMIGFQNCSNSTQFVSDESNILKSTGVLAPVASDSSENDSSENTDVADDSDAGDPPSMPSPPPAMPPVAEMPPAPPAPPVVPVPVMSPTPSPVASVPPPVEHDEDENEHEHEMEDADRSYVCILQGPGKSVKVGIVSDVLGGGNSAAASVCMSKRACLELMSKKFPVKSAEKRGYCPAKSPNAVNMSDAEIKAKLLGQ